FMEDEDDRSPERELYEAAAMGKTDLVSTLLSSGHVSPYGRGRNGNAAIHVAAGSGHLNVCRELLKAGVPIELENDNGNTAIMNASFWGHLEVVRYLIQQGADVCHVNNQRNTAALFAAQFSRYVRSNDR